MQKYASSFAGLIIFLVAGVIPGCALTQLPWGGWEIFLLPIFWLWGGEVAFFVILIAVGITGINFLTQSRLWGDTAAQLWGALLMVLGSACAIGANFILGGLF